MQATLFCIILNSSTAPFLVDWKPQKWFLIDIGNKWLKIKEVFVLPVPRHLNTSYDPGSRDESGVRKVDPAVSSETTEALTDASDASDFWGTGVEDLDEADET